eukprot:8578182-Karenia_brevis.AAC.1
MQKPFNLKPCALLLPLIIGSKIQAMPRQSYTSQRMRTAAERSVANFHRSQLGEATTSLVDVSCEYEGIAQPDGSYDPHGAIRVNSKVGFRWRANFHGPQCTVVEVRADHAVGRGV